MWDINGILDRLERQKHMISGETFKQIANPEYYYPEYQSSFHDAWLITLDIEYGTLDRLLKRSFDCCEIALRLLGPYHDMFHYIRYLDVLSHDISIGSDAGDLLEHAFLINDDGRIVHEITFVGGTMRFECADVKIETMLLTER